MTGNKGIIIATIISALIGAAAILYTHFDDSLGDLPADNEKIYQIKEEESESEPNPSMNFEKVFVTPIDTKMPSSFFVEISNTGNAAAKDFVINIDFGESKVKECEFLPSEIFKNTDDHESSIKRISISELNQKQSLYVVCATNSPLFKSISIGGGNIERATQLVFEDYKKKNENESLSFYTIWFRIIVSVFGIIFIIFLFRLIGVL